MKTIALRFGEHFAPECGTIAAHQQVINAMGFVWYGKLGVPVSEKIKAEILASPQPRILLISSGKAGRYWAHISAIQREVPAAEAIPAYYRETAEKFKTWFKVTAIDPAPKNIMSQCRVASSQAPLGEASKYSMSPYFIICYEEEEM